MDTNTPPFVLPPIDNGELFLRMVNTNHIEHIRKALDMPQSIYGLGLYMALRDGKDEIAWFLIDHKCNNPQHVLNTMARAGRADLMDELWQRYRDVPLNSRDALLDAVAANQMACVQYLMPLSMDGDLAAAFDAALVHGRAEMADLFYDHCHPNERLEMLLAEVGAGARHNKDVIMATMNAVVSIRQRRELEGLNLHAKSSTVVSKI